MNIIKRENQRAVIHLSRIGRSEMFLARALVFTENYDGTYLSHLVGIKRLNAKEAADLRLKAKTLAEYNITLVDTDVVTALLGIPKPTVSTPVVISEKSIRSPYASKITTLEAFLTSQKTRAPTR